MPIESTPIQPTELLASSRASSTGPSAKDAAEEPRQLTPLENALHDGIDDLENMQELAKERINDMFELLDLDELLKDPKGYMTHFGSTIIKSHLSTTVKEAATLGRTAGKKISAARKE